VAGYCRSARQAQKAALSLERVLGRLPSITVQALCGHFILNVEEGLQLTLRR